MKVPGSFGVAIPPRQAVNVSVVVPIGNNHFIQGETNMPLATIIRIVAGALFVVVLGVLVARRKAKNA
jgi:hypothetical protein